MQRFQLVKATIEGFITDFRLVIDGKRFAQTNVQKGYFINPYVIAEWDLDITTEQIDLLWSWIDLCLDVHHMDWHISPILLWLSDEGASSEDIQALLKGKRQLRIRRYAIPWEWIQGEISEYPKVEEMEVLDDLKIQDPRDQKIDFRFDPHYDRLSCEWVEA